MGARWFDRAAAWVSLGLLGVAAFAFVAWLPTGPGGPSFADFAAYFAAGRTWAHGGDPYGTAIWTIERTLPGFDPGRLELMPFVGPPLSLPLWSSIGTLPFTFAAAGWTAIVAACAALIVIVSYRLVVPQPRRAHAIPLALLAVSSAPLAIGISAGQTALPAIAAIIVALRCALRRQYVAFALAVVAAGVLKPNLALALVAIPANGSALVAGIFGVLLSAAGNLALAPGIDGVRTYLRVIAEHGRSEQAFAFQYAPLALAYGFGAPPWIAVPVATATGALAVGAAAVWAILSRAPVLARTAVAAAVLPFALPYAHEPDMAIAVLPALYALFRARGSVWVLGAAGTVMLLAYPLALTQGAPGKTFALAIATVCAIQVVRLAPAHAARLRFAPLAVVPLLALLAFFAPHGQVAIWPATVPAATASPPEASPSAIWRTELAALHLDGAQPRIALLRMLTLTGCALVGIATAATARNETRDRIRRRTEVPQGALVAASSA